MASPKHENDRALSASWTRVSMSQIANTGRYGTSMDSTSMGTYIAASLSFSLLNAITRTAHSWSSGDISRLSVPPAVWLKIRMWYKLANANLRELSETTERS